MNIMLDYGQKRKVRGFMYHRATLVVLGVIVLIVLHSTWVVYTKKRTSEEMKNISLQNVESLRERNSDLQSKIDRLDTVPGKEEEIRSKFGLVKDKENMVVIVPDESPSVATTTRATGFWANVVSFFHGN